ncbi:MAG: DeoR family transcriptional regulator, partial [Patescibacteria group bacterium]
MENRKEQLFHTIVRQHIALGEPIGSRYLLEKSHLDCSPATVRNDLAELEQEGFLTHPHTSAGRVPTEKGWKWFLERFITEQDV